MVKVSLVCLVLVLSLWGCDSGGGKSKECFPELQLNVPPDWLTQFEDCPTEGFVQICNPYFCNFVIDIDNDLMQAFERLIDPNLACMAIDCFNVECDLFIDTEPAETGLFAIDEILNQSGIAGNVFVEGEEFDYVCDPLIR